MKVPGLHNLLMAFACCLSITGWAQSSTGNAYNNPVAVATTKGVWVYLGNFLPKDGYYQVERQQTGGRAYEVIGKVTAPANRQEMENRQANNYFNKLNGFRAGELDRIWNYVQQHRSNDSLVSPNLPLMHLLIGTGLLDQKVEKDQRYTYRVSLMRNDGSRVQSVETKPVSWPQSPVLPAAVFMEKKFANGQLFLQWYVKEKKDLAFFNVYRSVFGKNEFSRVAAQTGFTFRRDSLILVAMDSIGNNASYYEYKIEPLDIYGNAGEWSGLCSGGTIEVHYASPVARFYGTSLSAGHAVRLRWEYDRKKYVSSITVMRSESYDTGYTRLTNLPPTDTGYTDNVPVAGENYYYYLLLNTPENEPIKTARVSVLYKGLDQPPPPPAGIVAETTINGVRVRWEYNEPFLKGFYVYRQGNEGEPFRQVSGMIRGGRDEYSYTDTSQALMGNKLYQYFVKSITDNDIISIPSDTVSAKPGLAASVQLPAHMRFRVNDNSILLSWNALDDIQPGLLGYRVYRKRTEEQNYVPLLQDAPGFITVNSFIDSNCSAGIKYLYAVSAIDMFGNESGMSLPVSAAMSGELSAPPAGIKGEVAAEGILLRWAQLGATNMRQFVIYRTEKGMPRKKIGTVNAEESEYLDKDITLNNLYIYEITVMDARQQESGFSDKVAVRYNW